MAYQMISTLTMGIDMRAIHSVHGSSINSTYCMFCSAGRARLLQPLLNARYQLNNGISHLSDVTESGEAGGKY